MINVVQTLAALPAQLSPDGRVVGLVPTMGALHDGHGRLLEYAREQCAFVVVSIFVNPLQFNQAEDFEKYPKVLDHDLDFCARHGVDLIFAPSAEEMYPRPQCAFVEVEGLTSQLCGKYRPGHFRGVATVVGKLFQIVRPHRAYFGEKDYQQLAVIRRMTEDLNFGIEIVAVPTVREADGLARSSRNVHLSSEERIHATVLYQALIAVQRTIASGETDASRAREVGVSLISKAALISPEIRFEYLEIVDPVEIRPVEVISAPVRIAGAIWVEDTRLIDNLPFPKPCD